MGITGNDMTFDNLVNIMYSWGHALKPYHYFGFRSYFNQMLDSKQVAFIQGESGPICILFFSIVDDCTDIHKKAEWDLPRNNILGNKIYVDKMICQSWTPSLRRTVQDWIEETFPQVDEGYYHKAPRDKCVKIYRRRRLCTV